MLADSQGIRFVIPEVGTGHLILTSSRRETNGSSPLEVGKGNDARGGEDAPNAETARSLLCQTDLRRSLFTVSELGDVDH